MSSTSTSKTRVVFLIQNFYPSIGGAERQALELARALDKSGLATVTVLTRSVPNRPSQEIIAGIQVYRLAESLPGFMVSSFMWLVFHSKDFDVIHAHLASSHALSAALAGRILVKRVVVKLSGSKVVGEIPVSKKSAIGRIKLKMLASLTPVLQLVSPAQAEDLNDFGLDKLERHIIPNGVDASIFKPADPEKRTALRGNVNWKGTIFLFVGRFDPDKLRLDVFENFMTAWGAAVKSGREMSFYLVGKGSLEPQYRSVITRLNLSDSVFIKPAQDKIAELYQAADVFVLPSITEGMSNAMLEAMASGLPVLGSRVEGIKEVVEEGENAELFDPFSTIEIEAAIRKFLGNDKKLVQMGKESKRIAEKFTISSVAKKIAEVYSA